MLKPLEEFKPGDLIAAYNPKGGENFVWMLVTVDKKLTWVYIYAAYPSGKNRFEADVYIGEDNFILMEEITHD